MNNKPKTIPKININDDKYKENENIIKEEEDRNNDTIIRDSEIYSNLEINKDYYLVCPNCKCRIPHIEEINYDDNNNDFKVLYNCSCIKSKESYLRFLFSIKEPSNLCNIHNNILNFYCKKCKHSICESCKNGHINHQIEDNNNFIPQEKIKIILEKVNEKKEHFKGTEILNKFIKRYLNERKLIPREEEKINDKTIKKYYYLKELKGHKDRVLSLIKLQSGWIATGSYDSIIRIWIPEANFCFKEIQEIGAVQCLLEFEPDKILSGTTENNICLRDIHSENDDDYICNFIGHYLWVNCLIKCSDKYFASASNDCTIRIWDYYKRKEIREIKAHEDCIFSLIKLKNGNLCSAGADLSIKFWDWEKGLCLKAIKNAHIDSILSLIELNERTLISSSSDKTIKIWKDYKCLETLNGHKNEVRTLCKIDDNYFASGSFDNKIKIWDLRQLNCFQTLEGHHSNVTTVIKLNNDSLASCSCDKTIIIWKQK